MHLHRWTVTYTHTHTPKQHRQAHTQTRTHTHIPVFYTTLLTHSWGSCHGMVTSSCRCCCLDFMASFFFHSLVLSFPCSSSVLFSFSSPSSSLKEFHCFFGPGAYLFISDGQRPRQVYTNERSSLPVIASLPPHSFPPPPSSPLQLKGKILLKNKKLKAHQAPVDILKQKVRTAQPTASQEAVLVLYGTSRWFLV